MEEQISQGTNHKKSEGEGWGGGLFACFPNPSGTGF